ncbi:GNAT family N-acetyltransferase [Fusibacter sp. JL216-2]|uniref:GNAT family N-acetyltransferase n=1 Tax=Fusibacter sp. JL216-2 TaxID=3071453 RepID=UPI003D34B26D
MDIIVRDMQIEEISDIAVMTANSTMGELYFQSDADKVQTILENARRDERVLVAVVDGKAVGFIWFDLNGVFRIHPYIHLHFVRTDMRGQGIGKALLKAFEESAVQISPKTFLAVAEFNFRASALYETEGYKFVGSVPGLYREGVTENLLMKNLKVQ